jgi:glycosyltransferase involved in cell wall biosynthesis
MKILLVVGRYPWPAVSGDRRRTEQFLEALGGSHEVTLLAPKASAGDSSVRFPGVRFETYRVSWLSRVPGLWRCLVGGHPWQAGLFYQPDLKQALRRLAAENDLVILQLARLALHVDDAGETPLALDFIDSLALNMATRARLEPFYRRFVFREEARRLRRWEAKLLRRSVLGWVVSERDRQALEGWISPRDRPRLTVLPLGQGGAAGAPPAPGGASRGAPPQIALTGNLGYFPMVEGSRWWLREVWPRLRRAFPDLSVVVAGARPSRSLRRACRQAGPGVRLVDSPPDLLEILSASTLAVAPMRCGSGRPTKVLEAWACGVPVVAHRQAAAGLAPGYEEAVGIAETPEEWEAVLSRLLRSPEARQQLGQAGSEFVRRNYDPAQAAQALLQQISRL